MQPYGRIFAWIGWASLLIALLWSRSAAAGQLQATSHGGHVWFVIPAGAATADYELCHHSAEVPGPFYKSQLRLPRLPLAMASWRDRLWLFFASNPQTSELRYEVFTVKVEKNEALGVYFIVPAGSLDIAPPLPGQWNLESVVATSEGPAVLLTPRPANLSPLNADAVPATMSTQPSTAQPRLMHLRGERWIDLDFPPGFVGGVGTMLLPNDAEEVKLTLLEAKNAGTGLRHDLSPGEQNNWNSMKFDGDVRVMSDRATVLGQTGVCLKSPASSAIEIALVRPEKLLPLAALPEPATPWAMVSTGSKFMVLENDSGTLHRQLIDPLSGESSPRQAMVSQPVTTGRIWQVSLLLAVSLSGLLLVFLIRPSPTDSVNLPKGAQAFPAHLRLAAAIIDMFPAALVTILLLRCSLAELLNLPLISIDIERSLPYLLMATLTVIHTTISEAAWGRSFGKRLLGARIVKSSGSAPRPQQVMLRGAVKLIVMLIPPLVLFALFSPHIQGLNDLAAGTVVIHDAQPESKLADDE